MLPLFCAHHLHIEYFKANLIKETIPFTIATKRTQINKIRNQRGEITTDTTKTQKITKGYYEQLYANKLDNLEAHRFLETHSLPKFSQEET